MTSIQLQHGVDHVFQPGDTVKGSVRTLRQINLYDVDVVLTGTLEVVRPGELSVDNNKAEIVFLETSLSVFSGNHTVREGCQWPFKIRIPAGVNWDTVESRYGHRLKSTLGSTPISHVSRQLPPSLGRFELGPVTITYELKAICHDANHIIKDRFSSKPQPIQISPPRLEEKPEQTTRLYTERFNCRNYNLDLLEGQERDVKSKFSDFLKSRTPPFYQFSINFKLPSTVIAGNKLRIKLQLNGSDHISNGNAAPKVVLDEFWCVIKSHTKVDSPIRYVKARYADNDIPSNVTTADAQIAKIKAPLQLPRGRSVDMRDHCPNIGPWAGEIPDFETYGIARTFFIEVFGTVSVRGTKFKFSLKPHDLRVFSPAYRPPPSWQPIAKVDSSDSEATLPPTYEGAAESAYDFAAAAAAAAPTRDSLAPTRKFSFEAEGSRDVSRAHTPVHDRSASFEADALRRAAAGNRAEAVYELPAYEENRRFSETPTIARTSFDSTVAKQMEDELFI